MMKIPWYSDHGPRGAPPAQLPPEHFPPSGQFWTSLGPTNPLLSERHTELPRPKQPTWPSLTRRVLDTDQGPLKKDNFLPRG